MVKLTKEQQEAIGNWINKRGNELLGGLYDGTYHVRHIFDILEHEAKNGGIK